MTTTLLEAAASYAARGMAVFPCEKKIPLTGSGGFKNASLDASQIHKWWTETPSAQIGLPTGEVNHLFVLDVDGPQGQAVVAKMNLPETCMIETRSGRFQFWFEQPAGRVGKCSAGVLGPQLDVRSDGGYVIALPSVHHETGKAYRFVKHLPLAPAPDWLLEAAVSAKPATSPGVILEGQGRHREMLKVAGSLRRQGLASDVILATLVPINAARCVPPLDLTELSRLSRYIGTKSAGNFTESTAEVELQFYHHIKREQVRWLWPHRIPRGKLTLFVGNPGTGKSLATIDLAARVSTGRMFPDGHPCERGNVLALTAEDDARDTVGPRLDAAGADSSSIARINAVKVTLADGATGESFFSLDRDLAKLEDTLKKHPDFKLLIIDPLTAYMGAKVNSWRDAEVRALLTPLTDFAMRSGIAAIGIMHMRKSETDAMLRVSGSIAFVAAARTVWGFGEDPEDPGQHVMVPVKNNLAALGNALAYQIRANGEGVPYVNWQEGPRNVDAEDVLGGNKREKREQSERQDEAQEWLRNQLSGGTAPQSQIKAAAEKAGIAWRTLERAKSRLSVRSHKAGLGGGWYWELPEGTGEGRQE